MLKPSKKPLITAFSISPLGGFLQHLLLVPLSGFLSGCGFVIGEVDRSRVWKPFLPPNTLAACFNPCSVPVQALIQPAFVFGQVDFQLGQPCDPASLCPMNTCTEKGMQLRLPFLSVGCFCGSWNQDSAPVLPFLKGCFLNALCHREFELSQHLAQFFKTKCCWSLSVNVS